MSKEVTHKWAAYVRNQEAVAQAIARKEYTDMTPTGVGVVDEFFALMEQIGIMKRLEVHGNYHRQMLAVVLLLLTYCTRIMMGLSAMNQLPTHLFRDAGLLRRIGFTAKQINEGICKRGKGKSKPVSSKMVKDALLRLPVEDSQGIFEGSVRDLVKAKLVPDTVFSMDGMEMHTTEKYLEAGKITSAREVTDKWGRTRKVTSTRYGYLQLGIRGVDSGAVVAAEIDKIGTSEHPHVLPLVRRARAAGVDIRILLIDGGYCVGSTLWDLKHKEHVDFIVPADSTMCITEDARSLARIEESLVAADGNIRAVGVKGLTSYDAYAPPKGEKRTGPKATLNALVVTRWNSKEVPVAEQVVLITSLPVDDPLKIVALYRKRAEMENKLHRELKQGWCIEKFPCKDHPACVAHFYLTLTIYNVACAYKSTRGQELADRGIRRLRAEHLKGAAWVAIVYTETEYGIFDLEEFAYLSGNPPKRFHRFQPDKP